jgi:hypothetical protein
MLKFAGFEDAEARATKIVVLEHAIREQRTELTWRREDIHERTIPGGERSLQLVRKR